MKWGGTLTINRHNQRLHNLIESNLTSYGKHMWQLSQGHCTSEEYVHELKKIRQSLKSTVKWLSSLIKDVEG